MRSSPAGRTSTRRGSSGSQRATRGPDPGDRQPLALRRRLHPGGSPLRRVPGRQGGCGPLQAARDRDPAGRELPPVRARHPVQRAADRPRHPSLDPSGSLRPAARRRLRRRPVRHPGNREPRDGDAGRGHQDAAPRSRSATSSRRSAPISRPGSGLDMSGVTLEALKDKLDPSLGGVRRRGAQPFVSPDRLRAAQAAAPRPDPAGEGGSRGHGAARVPRPALWSGTRLRQSLDRLGHRGIGRQDQPRRPGEVPPDLVQAEQRHPDRRRAPPPWRRSGPSWSAPSPAGPRATCPRRTSAPSRSSRARRCTCSIGPEAMQSLILVGNVAPPKANPDEPAIETMNMVLGGSFHSRGST